MKRPRPRALAVLTAAGALVATAAVSGCSYLSPASTELEYNPADGVSATVGDVIGRNLVVVGGKGTEGLVSGALINEGNSASTVTITSANQPQPVTVNVPPGQLVTLGGAGSGATVVVGNLTRPAGTLMPITLTSPTGGDVSVRLPIVPAQFAYATVTPTAD